MRAETVWQAVAGEWDGALGLCGGQGQRAWQLVEGTVKAEAVVAWLEQLAGRASAERPVVAVWDQASYHTAREVRERLDEWAARGLHVYLLPAYGPQLNLIERCWLELKARLLPRRWYDDGGALRAGVEAGLQALVAQLEKGLFNIGGTYYFNCSFTSPFKSSGLIPTSV